MAVSLTKNGVLSEAIRVLVVDHDSTCLTIVSKMLLLSGYEVVTTNCAVDALTIAHEGEDELHLILTEANLPDMGRYEFLEKIQQVTKLPVVNEKDSSKLGCLFKGAMLYLVKPLSMKSIRSLWQFAFIKTRHKTVSTKYVFQALEESEPVQESESENQSLKNGKKKWKMVRRKDSKKVGRDLEEENGVDSTVLKKPKLIWTKQLHSRFLQAIRVLGIDKAHPKEILQYMNVPGLKKENISSHLQKFRLALKRDQDATQNEISGNFVLEDAQFQFSDQRLTQNSSYQSKFRRKVPFSQEITQPQAGNPLDSAYPSSGHVGSSINPASFEKITTPSPTFPPPPPLQEKEKHEIIGCEPPEPPSEADQGGGGRGFECGRDMAAAAINLPSPEEDEECIVDERRFDDVFDIILNDSYFQP